MSNTIEKPFPKTLDIKNLLGVAVRTAGGWDTDHPQLTKEIQRGDLSWPNRLVITNVSHMMFLILGDKNDTVTRQLDPGAIELKTGFIQTLAPFYIAANEGATFNYVFVVPA